MFKYCIFCNHSLGANEVVEQFPIGRRLAFDSAQGRLWAVCAHCNRWNLSPIEERWEAIDTCERLYRDTRTRLATEHIGLARVAEGTDLVRIGRPQRPEFAAWRYGETLRKRRRKLYSGAGWAAAAMVGGLVIAKPLFAVISGVPMLTMQAGFWVHQYQQSKRFVVRMRRDSGEWLNLNLRLTSLTSLENDREGWILRVRDQNGWHSLRGGEAMRASGLILPLLNQAGASAREVRDAVKHVETTPDPHSCFAHAATRLSVRPEYDRTLAAAPAPQRLALEMVAHEDHERRALEGELHELEAMWREAEEVAAISDNLLLPRAITERFRERKTE